MFRKSVTIAMLFACACILAPWARAESGMATYQSVCMACHASGVSGAPKLGDKKAWAGRINEGQAVLTAHAYVGLGAMPAKGGKPDLSLEEFSEAVVYMANQAGAKWRNPDDKRLELIRTEIVKREKALAAKAAKANKVSQEAKK